MGTRLLHSPNLVVIGPSMGYETWPPIGWHYPVVIGWSKHRLGLPGAPLHYGLMWPVGIPTDFRHQWQSLCTALTANKCLQGDCERVSISAKIFQINRTQRSLKSQNNSVWMGWCWITNRAYLDLIPDDSPVILIIVWYRKMSRETTM